MKNVITLSFIFCLTVFGFAQNKEASNIIKQKVLDVSNRDLVSFLNNIPSGFENQHGFNDREEFKSAAPGSIYRIVGIDENGKTFETNTYNVSVVVNGEYRSMITVSLENGNYEIQTVGAALLAKELQVIENNNNAEGLDKIMLNVYSKQSGFVAYEKENTSLETASFAPLASASNMTTGTSMPRKANYKLAELRNYLNQ